jgi:HEAT repeat protein
LVPTSTRSPRAEVSPAYGRCSRGAARASGCGAAAALGEIGDLSATDDLIAALKENVDLARKQGPPGWRTPEHQAFVDALVAIGDERTVPLLAGVVRELGQWRRAGTAAAGRDRECGLAYRVVALSTRTAPEFL